jgi:hypothetical protein
MLGRLTLVELHRGISTAWASNPILLLMGWLQWLLEQQWPTC